MKNSKLLGGPLESNLWRVAAKNKKLIDFKIAKKSDQKVEIIATTEFPETGAKATFKYDINSNGVIDISVIYDYSAILEKNRNAHRSGMQWQLAPNLNTMQWYGKGPSPTYIDRDYEPLGIYKGTVDEQWIDYSRPQENGGKSNVRWVKMTDNLGKGLLFETLSKPVSIGARHYSDEEMEKAKYSFNMKRSDVIYFNIDAHQLGVGGNNSWGRPPMEIYQTKKDRYKYNYRITPLK